ncbi:hypothetical protein GWI33_011357 [Rhynchophorus ferrugineus]|uniref:Uncharacterized protein n=1 Tax=Rhynchophorus ferrugineus TaxID=354439 RepID=A0A834MET8_RHYFE|nr:hypothetical protein GWI33_011357 [Rhynchophorus ferrugineus]
MDDKDLPQNKSIVRVRSLRRHNRHDDPDDEDAEDTHTPLALDDEEILDPYTIKRRESVKNSIFDIYVKVIKRFLI